MRFFKRKKHLRLPEVVYELKPGGHYLIEYSSSAVTQERIKTITKILNSWNIRVLFVPNPSHHVAFTPVPATPERKSTDTINS